MKELEDLLEWIMLAQPSASEIIRRIDATLAEGKSLSLPKVIYVR
jgi:hypothetical protein